ncbi:MULTISPECIES: hypothetical protein [unclassified Caballeronia]|uniref:hypothetical protein n=1 Tax=unclassified Caballeronia TaxID=2646786 RepID=UPI0020287C33|nr:MULTISPECIES: hypothetical protein [unclassified Caballeronia]
MNANSRPLSARSYFRTIVFAAACLSSSRIAMADTIQLRSTGTQGYVSVALSSSDNCTFGSVTLNISEAGTTSQNAPITTPSGFATIYFTNLCTGSYYFGSGSGIDVKFSAQGSGNGSKVAKTVTASGTIPISGSNNDSDTLSFSMTLNAQGTTSAFTNNDTSTTTSGSDQVTTRRIASGDFSYADTVSLSVSTNKLGPIYPAIPPLSSSAFSIIYANKSQTLTVIH